MPRIRNFLPGAEPTREQAQQEQPDYEEILGRPVIIGGEATEDFYGISSLAAALNRSPGTIREWERLEIIPKGYVINGASPNGRRRLYTARQILGLRQLADECGVLYDLRAVVKDSEFSQAAFILFEQLKDAA